VPSTVSGKRGNDTERIGVLPCYDAEGNAEHRVARRPADFDDRAVKAAGWKGKGL
jgi:hypothetical protein